MALKGHFNPLKLLPLAIHRVIFFGRRCQRKSEKNTRKRSLSAPEKAKRPRISPLTSPVALGKGLSKCKGDLDRGKGSS